MLATAGRGGTQFRPKGSILSLAPELITLVMQPFTTPPGDYATLASVALVCKGLIPYARAALYRVIEVRSRTAAKAWRATMLASPAVGTYTRHLVVDIRMWANVVDTSFPLWFTAHGATLLSDLLSSTPRLMTLTLHMTPDSTAFTEEILAAVREFGHLRTLTKDLEPAHSPPVAYRCGVGCDTGIDVPWYAGKRRSIWLVRQVWSTPSPLLSVQQADADSLNARRQLLATINEQPELEVLRVRGIASTGRGGLAAFRVPPRQLTEVVLIDISVSLEDALHIVGRAETLRKFTLWGSGDMTRVQVAALIDHMKRLEELRVGQLGFGTDEDAAFFPIDEALPSLPNLRILHCSGPLITPVVLSNPTLHLEHLAVASAPAFSPPAVYAALLQMRTRRTQLPPTTRLSLADMRPVYLARALYGNEPVTVIGPGETDGLTWTKEWRTSVVTVARDVNIELDDGARGCPFALRSIQD